LPQLSIMGAMAGPGRNGKLIRIYFTNENLHIRLIGLSNSWRAPILQARTAVSLFAGLSNYWEGPATLVLLLAISRKGPLKCLLGGPRSRGVRFLGPCYRRRRPRPPISLDFSGLGWFWGGPAWAQGWAQTGSVVGPRVVLKWFWDRARTPEPPETARGPTNSPFGAYNNMTVGGVWGLGRG